MGEVIKTVAVLVISDKHGCTVRARIRVKRKGIKVVSFNPLC